MTPSSEGPRVASRFAEARVRDLLRSTFVEVTPDLSLAAARELMERRGVRTLLVRAEGSLVGLVTREVVEVGLAVKRAVARTVAAVAPAQLRARRATPVSRVMSRRVWRVGPDVRAPLAALRLQRSPSRCLVVMDGECVMGTLEPLDFVRYAQRSV